MDNKNKFSSLLEEDDSFEEINEQPKKNKLHEEVSIDELFDFKPIGVVGDESNYLKDSFSTKKKNDEQQSLDKANTQTKRQKLESILKEPTNEKIDIKENKKEDEKPSRIDSIFKEEVVLFDEENSSDKVSLIDNENIAYDENKIKSLIESAMYVCGNEGLSLNDLKRLTGIQTTDIKRIIKKWNDELEADKSRGISIKIYGERYKLFSKNENREDLSKLITIKYRNPLSSKVMETLAIIAYNQPCTRVIIEDIRGKDPTATIQKLIDLELVAEAGRADTPGRPLLYTVTHKFYDIFGIRNLSELPKINLDQPFDDQDISFFDTTRFND